MLFYRRRCRGRGNDFFAGLPRRQDVFGRVGAVDLSAGDGGGGRLIDGVRGRLQVFYIQRINFQVDQVDDFLLHRFGFIGGRGGVGDAVDGRGRGQRAQLVLRFVVGGQRLGVAVVGVDLRGGGFDAVAAGGGERAAAGIALQARVRHHASARATVIQRAAGIACQLLGDAFDERAVVDFEADRDLQRPPQHAEQRVQRLRLGDVAREAVDDETALGVARAQALLQQLHFVVVDGGRGRRGWRGFWGRGFRPGGPGGRGFCAGRGRSRGLAQQFGDRDVRQSVPFG